MAHLREGVLDAEVYSLSLLAIHTNRLGMYDDSFRSLFGSDVAPNVGRASDENIGMRALPTKGVLPQRYVLARSPSFGTVKRAALRAVLLSPMFLLSFRRTPNWACLHRTLVVFRSYSSLRRSFPGYRHRFRWKVVVPLLSFAAGRILGRLC